MHLFSCTKKFTDPGTYEHTWTHNKGRLCVFLVNEGNVKSEQEVKIPFSCMHTYKYHVAVSWSSLVSFVYNQAIKSSWCVYLGCFQLCQCLSSSVHNWNLKTSLKQKCLCRSEPASLPVRGSVYVHINSGPAHPEVINRRLHMEFTATRCWAHTDIINTHTHTLSASSCSCQSSSVPSPLFLRATLVLTKSLLEQRGDTHDQSSYYWHGGERASSAACHQVDCTSPLIIPLPPSSHCHLISSAPSLSFIFTLLISHSQIVVVTARYGGSNFGDVQK